MVAGFFIRAGISKVYPAYEIACNPNSKFLVIKPERIRQIKLDAIKKQEAKRQAGSCRLADNIGDVDEDNFCANCFI